MSLRAKILTHSLPLLPTHSFTRQTLSLALSRLSADHPDYISEVTPDSTLDTLFGDGSAGPKALVRRWEEEGLEKMSAEPEASGSGGSKPLDRRLRARLSFSADVGEHLVEVRHLVQTS